MSFTVCILLSEKNCNKNIIMLNSIVPRNIQFLDCILDGDLVHSNINLIGHYYIL